MDAVQEFRLSGVAMPADAEDMLTEICEHFIEHADVRRTGDEAMLTGALGSACIRIENGKLLIELNCPSEQALQLTRTSIAEHLFYFAGDDPLELSWAEPAPKRMAENIHHVSVVSVEDITPRMRRVKFACADVTPFIGGDMHVRLLVPPKGRTPVWPSLLEDGRLGWPQGEDEILVRVYTIRSVDVTQGELWIDFLQHPAPCVKTPGADFARAVLPGEKVALLGPGGGALPVAQSMLLAGDETALPAIARIASEVQAGTRIQAIIEVEDEMEEQTLSSAGTFDVRWLHRRKYLAGEERMLATETMKAIELMDGNTFVWFACEKEDVRFIRGVLNKRGHDRKKRYIAWYWERSTN